MYSHTLRRAERYNDEISTNDNINRTMRLCDYFSSIEFAKNYLLDEFPHIVNNKKDKAIKRMRIEQLKALFLITFEILKNK